MMMLAESENGQHQHATPERVPSSSGSSVGGLARVLSPLPPTPSPVVDAATGRLTLPAQHQHQQLATRKRRRRLFSDTSGPSLAAQFKAKRLAQSSAPAPPIAFFGNEALIRKALSWMSDRYEAAKKTRRNKISRSSSSSCTSSTVSSPAAPPSSNRAGFFGKRQPTVYNLTARGAPVLWICGPTGCGKTRMLRKLAQEGATGAFHFAGSDLDEDLIRAIGSIDWADDPTRPHLLRPVVTIDDVDAVAPHLRELLHLSISGLSRGVLLLCTTSTPVNTPGLEGGHAFAKMLAGGNLLEIQPMSAEETFVMLRGSKHIRDLGVSDAAVREAAYQNAGDPRHAANCLTLGSAFSNFGARDVGDTARFGTTTTTIGDKGASATTPPAVPSSSLSFLGGSAPMLPGPEEVAASKAAALCPTAFYASTAKDAFLGVGDLTACVAAMTHAVPRNVATEQLMLRRNASEQLSLQAMRRISGHPTPDAETRALKLREVADLAEFDMFVRGLIGSAHVSANIVADMQVARVRSLSLVSRCPPGPPPQFALPEPLATSSFASFAASASSETAQRKGGGTFRTSLEIKRGAPPFSRNGKRPRHCAGGDKAVGETGELPHDGDKAGEAEHHPHPHHDAPVFRWANDRGELLVLGGADAEHWQE